MATVNATECTITQTCNNYRERGAMITNEKLCTECYKIQNNHKNNHLQVIRWLLSDTCMFKITNGSFKLNSTLSLI